MRSVELADLANRDRPVRFRLRRDGTEREVTLTPVVRMP
jgi:hypothetical protein